MDRTEEQELRRRALRAAIIEQYGDYQRVGAEIGISHQAVSDVVNGHTVGATARYSLAKAVGRHPRDFWPEDWDTQEAQPAATVAAD